MCRSFASLVAVMAVGGLVLGQQNADLKTYKITAPLDGTIGFLGTPLGDKDQAPADRVITIDGTRYKIWKVGDPVMAGRVLGKLNYQKARHDVAVKKARLDAANAEYQAAESLFKEAQARCERAKALHDAKAIAFEEYAAIKLTRDKYKFEQASKVEQVKLAMLEVAEAEATLQQHELRSPVNGIIRAIYKTHGDGLNARDGIMLLEIRE